MSSWQALDLIQRERTGKVKPAAKPAAKPGKSKGKKKRSPSPSRSPSPKRKSKGKGKPTATSGGRKKPKWHPGTVALREIRRYQKSTELLSRKAPFDRLVEQELGAAELQRKDEHQYRQTSNFRRALREWAEGWAVNVFERTNRLAIHAKRVTVQAKDIDEALTQQHDSLGTPEFADDVRRGGARTRVVEFQKPTIRRLARRGGVKRISGNIYAAINAVVGWGVYRVLQKAVVLADYDKVGTLDLQHLNGALKRYGMSIYTQQR